MMTYNEYINSAEWREVRERKFQDSGNRCFLCNSNRRVHVHHKKYPAVWGTELPSDLTVLCETHHHELHYALKLFRMKIKEADESNMQQLLDKYHAEGGKNAWKRTKKQRRAERKLRRLERKQRANPQPLTFTGKMRSVMRRNRHTYTRDACLRIVGELTKLLAEPNDVIALPPQPTQGMPPLAPKFDGPKIKITKAMLQECRTDKGAFTAATMTALGITKHTIKLGWAKELVGVEMPEQQFRAAVAGRVIYRTKFVNAFNPQRTSFASSLPETSPV